MTVIAVRIIALILAVKGREGWAESGILSRAQIYERYIRDGTRPSAD